MRLRVEGHSLDEIAQKLGYAGKSSVSDLIAKALRDIPADGVDALRTIECARLDAMLLAAWPRAMKGDTRSLRVLTMIGARRAKLMGLDAPVMSEITGADGGAIEILATAHDGLLAELARIAANGGAGKAGP